MAHAGKKRVWDVISYPGITVMGVHYCPYTQKAVKTLTEHRTPFTYVSFQSGRAGCYVEMLGDVLKQQYMFETDEEFKARGGVPHKTAPAIILGGPDPQLIGGNDQLNQLIAEKWEEFEKIRKLTHTIEVEVVPIPPDAHSAVPDSTVQAVGELVQNPDTEIFRYLSLRQDGQVDEED